MLLQLAGMHTVLMIDLCTVQLSRLDRLRTHQELPYMETFAEVEEEEEEQEEDNGKLGKKDMSSE